MMTFCVFCNCSCSDWICDSWNPNWEFTSWNSACRQALPALVAASPAYAAASLRPAAKTGPAPGMSETKPAATISPVPEPCCITEPQLSSPGAALNSPPKTPPSHRWSMGPFGDRGRKAKGEPVYVGNRPVACVLSR